MNNLKEKDVKEMMEKVSEMDIPTFVKAMTTFLETYKEEKKKDAD